MPYLHHWCPKLMNPKFWFTTSSSCSDVTSGFFCFTCAPYLFHFHNCTHPATSRVPLFCSFYTFIHCSMLYCPNPSCTRNVRNTRKAFPNVKSFSHHLQQSPECKPFVLNQTVVIAPTMQASSKRASTNGTANLFKKQQLWLNPTFTQEQHDTKSTNTHTLKDQLMDDDDVSVSHDNAAHQSGSLTDEDSIPQGILWFWRIFWQQWFCWWLHWITSWKWLLMFHHKSAMCYIFDVFARCNGMSWLWI